MQLEAVDQFHLVRRAQPELAEVVHPLNLVEMDQRDLPQQPAL
jgi:hypothetical protein